jgi:hypothetical protein
VDEAEQPELRVPLDVARSGFPAICAITGETADGAIPVQLGRSATKWKAHTIRVPLSERVFKKWSRRRSIHIKARVVAAVLASVAIVITFRNATLGLSILAVAVAVHLVDLWGERTSEALQPSLERDGDELVITGVHATFAAAVEETIH